MYVHVQDGHTPHICMLNSLLSTYFRTFSPTCTYKCIIRLSTSVYGSTGTVYGFLSVYSDTACNGMTMHVHVHVHVVFNVFTLCLCLCPFS